MGVAAVAGTAQTTPQARRRLHTARPCPAAVSHPTARNAAWAASAARPPRHAAPRQVSEWLDFVIGRADAPPPSMTRDAPPDRRRVRRRPGDGDGYDDEEDGGLLPFAATQARAGARLRPCGGR
jgi:hypothetical protein